MGRSSSLYKGVFGYSCDKSLRHRIRNPIINTNIANRPFACLYIKEYKEMLKISTGGYKIVHKRDMD